MRNIVLVGFMGTGKTVVGKALAENLRKKYISTDDLIEEKSGKTIKDIFAEEGEPRFRQLEKEVVKSISEKEGQIIDTGGGVILDRDNVDNLKKTGHMICLWADPDTILARTGSYSHRPLLNVEDPKKKIEELLEYRRPFYEDAHFHVDTTSGDIMDIVEKIIKIVKTSDENYAEEIERHDVIALWELMLEKLLQTSDLPVMVTDHKGTVVFANKKYMDCFVSRPGNVVGQNCMDMLASGYGDIKVKEALEKMKSQTSSFQLKMPVICDNNREECFRWVSTPLKNGALDYILFLGRPEEAEGYQGMVVEQASNSNIIDMIFASTSKNEPDTAKHSLRVTQFAVSLAEKLDIGEENIEKLRIAALLHDIGKIVVDEKILMKKGRLDKKEFTEIMKHPDLGVDMIRPVTFLKHVLPIMICHHENYDGKGYPKGISGKEIPIEARILTVADVYEALTADRPYRKAFSREEALRIMKDAKGKKLDPEITDTFIDMVMSGQISEEIC